MTENAEGLSLRQKPWWHFWEDFQRDVRHLQIDYSVREREKQIRKIVDDNGFKFKIFFVAASGFLASSYSLFATNVITPSLEYVFPPCGRLSGNASEVIDLVTLVGAAVGMVFMGHLADRSGRKKLYGLELAILIVATMGVVQASEGFMTKNKDGTTKNSMDIYAWISFWRFTLGFGIGAEYPLSAVITAEWASTESRGTMLAAVFSMQSVSRLLAFAINLGTIRDSNLASLETGSDESKLVVDRAWRLTIGLGVIPAAIAVILRLTIPETPRYYADIMKDLRKAVKSAFKIYGRNKKMTDSNSVNSGPSRQDSDDQNDRWFQGAWNYLTGPKKAWRNLVGISVLWGVMDVAWYGLSMDSPSALSTLVHDPSNHSSSFNVKRSDDDTCNNRLWNADLWDPSTTVDKMLQDNSIRSLLIVSIASFLGSIAAIVIINRFRRKSILMVTFLLLSLLFAVSGGTLIAADRAGKVHLVTIVFYAILQFVFNLGPNTLIFVLAAEIFPTVYRGTFFGLAAACGKIGAIIIRAIVGRTKNSEKSLGIRLLVFIPFMLLAAWISTSLPDVQYLPKKIDVEALAVEQTGSEGEERPEVMERPASVHNQQQAPGQEEQAQRTPEVPSLDGGPSREREGNQPEQASPKVYFLGRLKNKALEDIAPNPAWDKKNAEAKADERTTAGT